MKNMEIEYKFAPCTRAHIDGVLRDPQIAPHLGGMRRVEMMTTYYDTPDGALQAAGYSLRTRRENARRVCTFKAGADVRRIELECTCQTLDEGTAWLLTRPALPEGARESLRAGAFVEIAGARFVRMLWPHEKAGTRIDLCFDVGEVSAGERCAPISEIEIELACGDERELHALARYLQDAHGLTLCAQSKLHRALALRASSPGVSDP